MAAAERITAAVEEAGDRQRRLPLLAYPNRGTRMQKARCVSADGESLHGHQLHNQSAPCPCTWSICAIRPRAGVRVVEALGHPPSPSRGALIGFLGPRVYELL